MRGCISVEDKHTLKPSGFGWRVESGEGLDAGKELAIEVT